MYIISEITRKYPVDGLVKRDKKVDKKGIKMYKKRPWPVNDSKK